MTAVPIIEAVECPEHGKAVSVDDICEISGVCAYCCKAGDNHAGHCEAPA